MYPSVISTFTTVNASDRLNSPSHSALHNSVGSVLTQVQTVVGTEGNSSVVGTLQYLIKSPASNGGGHVQGAAFGGTGQTNYAKGDILVAQSASVLSKLVLGEDGSFLQADSSQSTGIKWSTTTPFSKITASVLSSVMLQGTVQEASIFSVVIPGSTLGTNNAIRATVNIRDISMNGPSTSSILIRAQYGSNYTSSVLVPGGNPTGMTGKLEYTLFANGTTSSQKGNLLLTLQRQSGAISSVFGVWRFGDGNASVASDADAVFGISAKCADADIGNTLTPAGLIVERIT